MNAACFFEHKDTPCVLFEWAGPDRRKDVFQTGDVYR